MVEAQDLGFRVGVQPWQKHPLAVRVSVDKSLPPAPHNYGILEPLNLNPKLLRTCSQL